MTTFTFANNINTTLAAAITATATTITLSSSSGLPSSIPSGEVLALTLNDAATRQVFEIVYVTAISGTTLTVTRAQEGTGAVAWSINDYAFSGPTAGQMGSLLSITAASNTYFPLNGSILGRLIRIIAITSSQTLTLDSNTTKIQALLVGGGGAGGGTVATSTSQFSAGAGGSAGTTVMTPLIAATGSLAITIGAGGVAVDHGAGGAGGTTSVGSLASTPGGGGGFVGTANSYGFVLTRGGDVTGSGAGSILFQSRGSAGSNLIGYSSGNISAGDGGQSFFGFGGRGGTQGSSQGYAGVNYGAGGGGSAVAQGASTTYAGGNGASGICIIWEFS